MDSVSISTLASDFGVSKEGLEECFKVLSTGFPPQEAIQVLKDVAFYSSMTGDSPKVTLERLWANAKPLTNR